MSDFQVATLPNYRFTALYQQALDFVSDLRSYAALLQAALEKRDADDLANLLAGAQRDLLNASEQVYDWQIGQAQNAIDGLNQDRTLTTQKVKFYKSEAANYPNKEEMTAQGLAGVSMVAKAYSASLSTTAFVAHHFPNFSMGFAGIGGTPSGHATDGGDQVGNALDSAANAVNAACDILDKAADLAKSCGGFGHLTDNANEQLTESNMEIDKIDTQIAGANLALQVAKKSKDNYQLQANQLQNQIDFLTNQFSNEICYDWMVGQLSDTYFKSYRLAYRLCKQVEYCYQFELGDDFDLHPVPLLGQPAQGTDCR